MSEIDRRKFLSGMVALATTSVIGCKSTSKAESKATAPARVEEGIGLGPEEANAPAMSNGAPAR